MRRFVLIAALALSGCAAPHLSLFVGKPAAPPPASPAPVCTPEQASPVPAVPLATDGPYHGFLLVAPVTDAEKTGFEVARSYFGDLLADDQAKTARLQRAAAYCGAKP